MLSTVIVMVDKRGSDSPQEVSSKISSLYPLLSNHQVEILINVELHVVETM